MTRVKQKCNTNRALIISKIGTHLSLKLFQQQMPGKLGFRDFREFIDDLLQRFQAFQSQRIAVARRGHERHTHQIRQVQNKKVA